ncbi:MAG: HEPN domain-containing protein [bacterium]
MSAESVKHWIIKAENDLKIAKDEMITNEPATDAVCFHAQQCAEKYLKAYLVFNGNRDY